MQHVGVTSASEVHKYPADIGKYLFDSRLTPDVACHCVSMSDFVHIAEKFQCYVAAQKRLIHTGKELGRLEMYDLHDA